MFVTFAAFAAFTLTTAIPFTPRSTGCDNPSTRQEWRALTSTQKSAYIEAVQCMASKPSQLGLSTTHYDDFPYIHNVLNNDSECLLIQRKEIIDLLTRVDSSLRSIISAMA